MKRKYILFILMLILIAVDITYGQLKDNNQFDIRSELLRPLNDPMRGLGFIDMSKFNMDHSVSMSFLSSGGNSLSQAMYLNTISYQFSDPLSVSLQWGIRSFPHNTFAGTNNQLFQNGLFFSGAEIEYKPSDTLHMKFEVSQRPYYNYYSRYRPWYDSSRDDD